MMLSPISDHSPEWVKARIGCWTASRAGDFMDMRKDGAPGARRLNYIAEIAMERLLGIPAEHFVSKAMRVVGARRLHPAPVHPSRRRGPSPAYRR